MDYRYECRCSGTSDPSDLGRWCGRPVTAEDGLCDGCRDLCLKDKRPRYVLTIEQVKQRNSDQGIPF